MWSKYTQHKVITWTRIHFLLHMPVSKKKQNNFTPDSEFTEKMDKLKKLTFHRAITMIQREIKV